LFEITERTRRGFFSSLLARAAILNGHVSCGQSDKSSGKGARLRPKKKLPTKQGKILDL
jgi:hypothetical protein